MVPFLTFLEKLCSLSTIFPKKDVMFHPAGGEILAHTEDRVSRVNYTSYAVGVQTGRLTSGKPASPAAAWYFFDLFGKKVALRATFFPKRMVGSALPEAKFPFGS
jgi:hypothetical protein